MVSASNLQASFGWTRTAYRGADFLLPIRLREVPVGFGRCEEEVLAPGTPISASAFALIEARGDSDDGAIAVPVAVLIDTEDDTLWTLVIAEAALAQFFGAGVQSRKFKVQIRARAAGQSYRETLSVGTINVRDGGYQ